MQVDVSLDPSRRAADHAAAALRRLLAERDTVRLLAATGNSQLTFLKYLVVEPGIEWRRVELFHLDEYVGVGEDHPASFAKYIREKLIEPAGIPRFHLLNGLADPAQTADAVGAAISSSPIDLAFAGIGENGHLAFNDPPADFETEKPYLIVELDEPCRRQQVGEGWFPDFEDVPRKALSISIRQLMKAHEIICVVPELRKAQAVAECLEGDVSPLAPASILRQHSNATVYLDEDSASLLRSR